MTMRRLFMRCCQSQACGPASSLSHCLVARATDQISSCPSVGCSRRMCLVRCRGFVRGFATDATGKEEVVTVQVPKLAEKLVSSAGTKLSSTSSNVLLLAAHEAERLLARQEIQTQASPTASPPPTNSNQDVDAVVDAVDTLLVVSLPSQALSDAILKRDVPEVASLHRAFLAMISWCLNVSTVGSDEETRLRLWDRTMALTRRSSVLALPLHLPLYQRLIDAAAARGDESAVAFMLECSGNIESLLHTPVDSRLFATSLCILIQQERYGSFTDLCYAIQRQHAIEVFDRQTVGDLLTLICDRLRHSLEQASTGEEIPAVPLLNLLKPSILEALAQDVQGDRMSVLLERLETLRTDDLLSRLHLIQMILIPSPFADGEHLFHDDDSDADDEDENDAPADMATTVQAITHAQNAQPVWTEFVPRGGPGVRILGDFRGGRVYAVQVEPEDSDKEEDEYHFPDVTVQLTAWNGGKPAEFTETFEEVLWVREYGGSDSFDPTCSFSDDDSDDSDDDEDAF